MSKHLLYCKDLLNRTLTRSLLLILAQLVACLIVLIQTISPAEAAGPLSVKPTHPRYFFDSNGKSVYLTGSYLNEYNTLSGSWDFASHLDFLQQQKQNFTRVWGWEQSPWTYDKTGQITFSTQPYERTGPGLALDGSLKFDLTRFNQAYFDQLHSRVVEAAQRGIYVSVMLFEGFSTQKKIGRVNPWLGDPFQQVNNINGINGDPNRNGSGEEFFSLAYPSLLALQEAFARKVVDTLNDLDNVLYEVSGNGLAGSLSWQYHMIDYIKRYQKKPAVQRPVGISDFYAGATADVFNSSADWIVIQETNLNAPPPTNKKVLIVEGSPVSDGQVLSPSPISLVQLMPDSVVSSQSSGISNNVPWSNGVTSLSSAATSSTLTTTQSSSNQQSQVATPTITPNGGVYSGTIAVTLQTTTPGASIYYTTDGQSPTQSSQRYTGKFKLSDSTLVKAKAFKNNFDPSSEASAWFANTDAVSKPGLVAHWKFDEGTGTTASDSSGNGNTGTLVNGPLWSAGKVGNALYFDGLDDVVTVADSNSLGLSSTFTLSAWVNPASTSTNWNVILKNDKYYLFSNVTGSACTDGVPLGGFSTTQMNYVCPSSPIPTNTWTHLTLTYDGSVLTLYQNGLGVASSNVSGTLSSTTGTLQIGGTQYGQYFKGFIDEVRVYSRALSVTEIQAIYQQESVETSQTVATPVISPNGGSYSGSVPITMQTATSGASIYYTTDGSTPTQSSTLYTGNMTLTSSATVKAKAFKSGSNASAQSSASFTLTQPFSFSVSNSGDKSVVVGSSVTNSISATLASGSAQAVSFSASGLPAGATASFSTASCSPNCSSTLTINTTGSTPAGSSTITVTATGAGVAKTTTFSLNVSLPTVATPTVSPTGGSYSGSVSVTLLTVTSGASIYYTTNGSTPTQSSTLYTGAMSLTSSATVKAKAFKSGYTASAEASASFTVTQPFSFSVSNSGDKSVVVGSSVTNSISATLASGSAQAVAFSSSGLPTGATASFSSASCTPACSSTLTINTTASTPAGSSTVTVAATGGGITKTTTFTLTVSLPTVATVATPTISPNGGSFTGPVSLTMQTATSGTSIYYTTNGSTPTQSSMLYAGAMTLTNSAVIKAKAFKSGANPSAETTASFTVSQPATPTITVDSTFPGYATSPIDDSVINASGGTSSTWASEETVTDHWINVAFPSPRQINSAIVHWAFNNYQQTYMTAQSVNIQYWNGSSYQTISSLVYSGSDVSSSSASFPTVTTSQLRFLMPAGQGNPGYPTVLWITELDYGLDIVAPAVAAPTITPNGGSFTGSVSVTMQTTSSNASIYYTMDGSSPTPLSTLYTGAMTLTSNAVVKAKAFKSGSNASAEASASFTVTQPFNFSLSNAGDKSVIAGSSVTNSISTTSVSGNSQAVSFSVSGLPSGATGSFSSGSCNPACSTILSINTIGSTPAGNFPITVTSTGGGVTRTTAFTLSVTLALTAASPAKGVTRYADGQLSSDCTSGNYSIAKRNCTGSDGNAYGGVSGLQNASNASTAGDTILVRSFSGAYTGSGGGQQVVPKSGSNMSNRSVIEGYQSEFPLIQGIAPLNDSNPVNYVIFRNVIIDGATAPDMSNTVVGVNFSRFENVTIRNSGGHGILGAADTEFINVFTYHNGYRAGLSTPGCTGFGCWCGLNDHTCHGIYFTTNVTIDGGEWYDNSGYGIHCSPSCSGVTIRNVRIHHNGGTGIILNGPGANFASNVVVDNNGALGLWIASSSVVENITAYNNGSTGICINGVGGGVISNSIALQNKLNQIDTGAKCGNNIPAISPTLSNNITSGDPASIFEDAANGNFQLQSTSAVSGVGANLY